MAHVKLKSKVDVKIELSLTLTLEEARALEKITKYGAKAFLEGYYKQLGKSYLQPHEKGVVSLFESIKENLSGQIRWADKLLDLKNTPIAKAFHSDELN
jgi:hypothetical protein